MANLKCNECERKAEVETKSSLFCTPCWYKDYVTLSRKETQNYGIRPLNRDYRVEYERAVIDYQNGGYLQGYMDDCETCEGCGEIEIDYEKHCIVDEMGNLYWKPDERF